MVVSDQNVDSIPPLNLKNSDKGFDNCEMNPNQVKTGEADQSSTSANTISPISNISTSNVDSNVDSNVNEPDVVLPLTKGKGQQNHQQQLKQPKQQRQTANTSGSRLIVGNRLYIDQNNDKNLLLSSTTSPPIESSLKDQHTMPLPVGWEVAVDPESGKNYFIDHNTRQTQWFDPRDRYTKPASFADCVGDELPLGWEYSFHPLLGVYFIDHNRRVNQLDDPRMEWLTVQANMVIDYLQQANPPTESRLSSSMQNSNQSLSKYYSNIGSNAKLSQSIMNIDRHIVENEYSNQANVTKVPNKGGKTIRFSSVDISQKQQKHQQVQMHRLNYDDNSDYAVIDCSLNDQFKRDGCGGVSSPSHSMLESIGETTTTSKQSWKHPPIRPSNQTQPDQSNHVSSSCLVNAPKTSYSNDHKSKLTSTYNRAILQQSLIDAKARVAQLKRELDANFNLLSIIDKYYAKGNNNEANAVEV